MTDPVSIAERYWGLSFKQVSHYEWKSLGGCPFCGDGGKGDRSDRFRIFTGGGDTDHPRYWCRQCNAKGSLLHLDEGYKPSAAEVQAVQIRQVERRLAEHERRLTALEQMAQSQDHLRYHQALNTRATEYWLGEGISEASIDTYVLGYCNHCPTDRDRRPSYTIPVINSSKLRNIRHRLIGGDQGDKYRPHMAGLGTQLFNADLLAEPQDRILVVEGEKKAIVMTQCGFPSVAILGKSVFKSEWKRLFDNAGQVIVGLDPDAHKSAARLAAIFGRRGRVAAFPVKPDDMVNLYGASEADVEAVLRLAAPVLWR